MSLPAPQSILRSLPAEDKARLSLPGALREAQARQDENEVVAASTFRLQHQQQTQQEAVKVEEIARHRENAINTGMQTGR